MNDGSEVLCPKDSVEHVWHYFALHAEQRMSMFNYFIAACGFSLAGLAGCLQASGVLRLVGAALGLAVACLAFVFWKLDQRTAFLLKHAETAMRALEHHHLPAPARLFRTEPEHTDDSRVVRSGMARMWTYRESFRLVFFIAAGIGIAGASLSIALFLGWCT